MEKKVRADLRIARARSGLSNMDVAHMLGCSRDRVSRLENGAAKLTLQEVAILQLIYGFPFEETFGILCSDVSGVLNERLHTIPQEPVHWAGKRSSRLSSLDRLSQRLQVLTENKYGV